MRAFFAVFCLVSAFSVAGCGSDAGPAAGVAGGGVHDNTHLPPGDVARGQALADKNSCTACHGADYSGAGFNPNLTPSGAGLGTWSDAQIAAAIRDGVHNDGEKLCSLMEQFPFSDQETADVIALLRSLAPSPKVTSVVCPGHGG